MSDLFFTPYAFSKLVYLRDIGDTEVGGFGVSTEKEPLIIEDIWLPKQECTAASIDFDEDSVAEWQDRFCQAGYPIDRFLRVWIHTHPGNSAKPSGTDESTCRKTLGDFSWSIMYILANGGNEYARLMVNQRVGGGKVSISKVIGTGMDWHHPFPESDHSAWDKEYEDAVTDVSRKSFAYPAPAKYQAPAKKTGQNFLSDSWQEHYGSSWERAADLEDQAAEDDDLRRWEQFDFDSQLPEID